MRQKVFLFIDIEEVNWPRQFIRKTSQKSIHHKTHHAGPEAMVHTCLWPSCLSDQSWYSTSQHKHGRGDKPGPALRHLGRPDGHALPSPLRKTRQRQADGQSKHQHGRRRGSTIMPPRRGAMTESAAIAGTEVNDVGFSPGARQTKSRDLVHVHRCWSCPAAHYRQQPPHFSTGPCSWRDIQGEAPRGKWRKSTALLDPMINIVKGFILYYYLHRYV